MVFISKAIKLIYLFQCLIFSLVVGWMLARERLRNIEIERGFKNHPNFLMAFKGE